MAKRLNVLDRAIRALDAKIAALQAARAELLEQKAAVDARPPAKK